MATVQQALHGYDRGHRLLSTSIEVGKFSGRLMLIASDLSGPSANGFSTYLTGYPLVEEGQYVLARTWAADELERPGCAWTHSLVVPTAELAQIHDLGVLLGSFRRPTSAKAEAYDIPLDIDTSATTSGLAPELPRLQTVLGALYGSPHERLLIPADDSVLLEAEVISAWSQQWPKLRRSFTFSTGSLAEREDVTGLSFDLQVIPQIRARSFGSLEGLTFVALNDPKPAGQAEWLAQEVVSPNAEFRDFLTRVGSDAGGRSAMYKLVEIFGLLARRVPVGRLVETVREHFDEGEARLLRAALFGPSERSPACASWIGERVRLEHLTTTVEPADYQINSAELRARALKLQAEDREGARELTARLLCTDLNPRGETLLGALSASWSTEDLVAVEARQAGAVAAIVRESPTFACEPALWSCLPDIHDDFVDALYAAEEVSEVIAARIIRATLESGRPPPPSLISSGGKNFVIGLLESASETDARLSLAKMPPTWLEAVTAASDACLEWLPRADVAASPLQARLLAEGLVRSSCPSIAQVPVEAWKSRFPVALDLDERNDRGWIEAAWIRVALCMPVGAARHLLGLGFHRLHESLLYHRLPSEVWRALAEILPQQLRHSAWDKAERLRMSVIRRVTADQLPVGVLLEICPSEPTIRYMCETLERIQKGGEVLAGLGRAIRQGQLDPNASQRRVIMRAVESAEKKARKAKEKKKKKEKKWSWW